MNKKFPTIEDLASVLKEEGQDDFADRLTHAAANSKMLHPELIMGSAKTGKTAELPMAKTGVGMSYRIKQEALTSTISRDKKCVQHLEGLRDS